MGLKESNETARLNPPCPASCGASALPEPQGTVLGLQRNERQAQGFSSNTHCCLLAHSTRSKHRTGHVKPCSPALPHTLQCRARGGFPRASRGLRGAHCWGRREKGCAILALRAQRWESGSEKQTQTCPPPAHLRPARNKKQEESRVLLFWALFGLGPHF